MNTAAIAWTALGAFAGIRALWRPYRAVVVDGVIAACAGTTGCVASMRVQTTADQRVLTPVSGRVIAAGGGVVRLVPEHEAVVLTYTGLSGVSVTAGQRVGAGQVLGASAMLDFSVSRIDRGSDGSTSLQPLVPSAWLAARGASVSGKRHPSGLWCGQGRVLAVPQKVAQCSMRLPEPPQLSLLPVSVSMQ